MATNVSRPEALAAWWGGRRPGSWREIAEDYAHVMSVFKLTTTDGEKTALASMLDTCTN
ncbi:hypothetical protein OG530_40410 [Streptomyces decoyicus]|uniref:hypothetical protein n=1 Tax=Streptomyces decoyicus TaxID=249567 RepID=UPI002E17A08E